MGTPVRRPSHAVASRDHAVDAGRRLATRAWLVASASFLLAATAVVAAVHVAQDGVLTYAIDDPLIHLSIARNLVRHGTFGVVPGAYESASSAPLWDLLLAPFLAVTPDGWWWPAVLNVAAALVLLRMLAGLPALVALAGRPLGLAAIAALPIGLGLVPLAATGMEHTLHALLTVAVLVLWTDIIGAGTGRARPGWVVALLAVGSLVRFETVFLAVGLAVSLAVVPHPGTRRATARLAAAVLGGAAVPVAAFAAVNVAAGQYPLPNSVVAKTALRGSGLPLPGLGDVLERVVADPLLLLLEVAAVVVALRARAWPPERRARSAGVVAMAVATGLHLVAADVGWFERYQAYLVVGLAAALLQAAWPAAEPAGASEQAARRRLATVVLVVSVMRVPLLVNTPLAARNVYENQYQLGRFLAAAYPERAVAVNDIGYVSWLHRGDLVDVAGLGSFEVLQAARQGRLGPALVGRLAADRGVAVLAVYDEFFAGLVPSGWQRAGRWCVEDRLLVLSSRCVSFYAHAGADAERLESELRRQEPGLPGGVSLLPP